MRSKDELTMMMRWLPAAAIANQRRY